MTWVKIDDRAIGHPKLVDAGAAGVCLWLAGLCYANSYGTGGLIPKSHVRRLYLGAIRVRSATDQLLKVGLWEDDGEHYRIHDYDEFQPSAEQTRALREKRQEAGRKGGKRSAEVRRGEANREASASSPPEATVKQPREPRPVPSRPVPSKDPPTPQRGDEIREVFEYWAEKTGHGRAKLDKKRAARIAARLREGFSAGQLGLAVDGLLRSDFHMGRNADGTRYDGVQVVFRDAEQVEKFIALGKEALAGRASAEERARRRAEAEGTDDPGRLVSAPQPAPGLFAGGRE